MSRLEIARLLIIVIGVAAVVVMGFLIILYRERRRRAHWSTRTRASNPHWSITLAGRIRRLSDRTSFRQRPAHHRRKRDL